MNKKNEILLTTTLKQCSKGDSTSAKVFNVLKKSRNPKIHAEVLKTRHFDALEYIRSIPQNTIDNLIAGLAVKQNGECIKHILLQVQTTGLLIVAISVKGSEVLSYNNVNQCSDCGIGNTHLPSSAGNPGIFITLLSITPEPG